MKTVIVVTWQTSKAIFGIYTDENQFNLAITGTAHEAKCTIELLKSLLEKTTIQLNQLGKSK